jgi:hypothetical protein
MQADDQLAWPIFFAESLAMMNGFFLGVMVACVFETAPFFYAPIAFTGDDFVDGSHDDSAPEFKLIDDPIESQKLVSGKTRYIFLIFG